MRPIYPNTAVWVFAALLFTSSGGGLAKADADARQTLQAKGLRLVGRVFVLPKESEFIEAVDKLRTVSTKVKHQEYAVQQLENQSGKHRELFTNLMRRRESLANRIQTARSPADKNRAIEEFNVVASQLDRMQVEMGDETKQREARSQLAESRSTLLSLMDSARSSGLETVKEYSALHKDSEVLAAMESINRSLPEEEKLYLGPSREFRSAAEMLKKREASVQTADIALRRNRDGTYSIETVINGKHSKEMIFDTGAAIVLITADFARQIGQAPTSSDPSVRLVVADGSQVEAKMIQLKSLRVGKFEATNVEAAVLPEGFRGVEALLGQSFLKHFKFEMDSNTGKLTLHQFTPGP